MPIAPPVACRCGKLDCKEHTGKAASDRRFDEQRKNDTARAIYRTKRWQRLRLFVIGRDPLCKAAKLCVQRYGVPMASTEADHIIPIRSGGDPWDPANLQGLCHEDHSHKTALENSQS